MPELTTRIEFLKDILIGLDTKQKAGCPIMNWMFYHVFDWRGTKVVGRRVAAGLKMRRANTINILCLPFMYFCRQRNLYSNDVNGQVLELFTKLDDGIR